MENSPTVRNAKQTSRRRKTNGRKRTTSWKSKISVIFLSPGEMAEWSIAAVLKTVELRGSGGSNPSLSAINAEY